MPASLDGRLVVAISSRALFDFEEENRLFEGTDDRAYMDLQLDRIEVPAKPGVAFSLVRKLLAFNPPDAPDQARVEVVILSRNDPASGLRVFRSVSHHGLVIERGVFTRGRSPWRYLKPLQAHLFLSANEADERSASSENSTASPSKAMRTSSGCASPARAACGSTLAAGTPQAKAERTSASLADKNRCACKGLR